MLIMSTKGKLFFTLRSYKDVSYSLSFMSHAVMKAFLNTFSSSGRDMAMLTAIAVEADQRNQV